jgi:glycosyltransferase involved in cell wall biosynthesis
VRVQGVVDNNVWPPRMGHTVRVWHLYRELARRPGVTRVGVIAALKSRERAVAREEREGVSIARIRPGHPTLFAWLERLGIAPLSATAEGYRRFPGPFVRAWDAAADVFEVDSLPLSPLLGHAPRGALRVYGSQNVEIEWVERVGSPVARRPRWARWLERLEGEALATADLVIAVSEADRDTFVARYGTSPAKIAVVENGFDAAGLRVPTPAEKQGAREAPGLAAGERGLLFIGTDFEHNRRAVEDLFRFVVPALAPLGARLWIVGDVSASFRARAEREADARVRAVPEQSDLLPWLWGCDVGLNPITTGAGSNVKLPTYLAAGLDVVTTPFGARGFERLAAYVTQAGIEAFADAIAAGASAGRDEPARASALASYAWSAQAARLHEAYAAALDARARRAGGAR